MHLFSNNAATTLAVALDADAGDTAMQVASAALFQTIGPDDGNMQLATLTHPDLAGLYEVVAITETVGVNWTVVREAEGAVQAWPIGTKVEARVTAAMLGTFLQRDPESRKVSNPNGGNSFALSGAVGGSAKSTASLVFGGASRVANSIQLSGRPYLQLTRSDDGAGIDLNLSYESVGGSIPVDLGSAATWAAGDYFRGSVVVPTVPDGYQYWLDITSVDDALSNDATEPAFDGPGGGAASASGWWFPTALPVDFTTENFIGLVVTEVGFIAHVVTASGTPSVSIGTESNATRFANNVALSQITAGGMIHRIPLSGGGALLNSEPLRFSVDTAATGGRFLGRFYWRGFFVETNPDL